MAPPLEDLLYEKCLNSSQPPEHVWTQESLKELASIDSDHALLQACNALMRTNRFQPVDQTANTAPGGHPHHTLGFRIRSAPSAAKYAAIPDANAREVYRLIEASGTAGIWKRQIKKRLELHENVIEKALRALQGARLIKQHASARNKALKTYMLADLEPAKDVTGGAWYTDAEMDDEFVEKVADLVVMFVRQHSWRTGHKVPAARHHRADNTPSPHGLVTLAGRHLLPHPPGYTEYPTAVEILDFVDGTGMIQGKNICVADLRELLTSLVYADRLEKVGRKLVRASAPAADGSGGGVDDGADCEYEDMYRWVRRPDDEDKERGPGNGVSEVPCGSCPVFRLCKEGGPVDARSCGYFDDWLRE